jgi:hypothetical protein
VSAAFGNMPRVTVLMPNTSHGWLRYKMYLREGIKFARNGCLGSASQQEQCKKNDKDEAVEKVYSFVMGPTPFRFDCGRKESERVLDLLQGRLVVWNESH